MDEVSTIAKCVVGVILGVVLTFAGCSTIQNYQDNTAIVQMTEHGSDPITARCAVRGESQTGGMCAIASSKLQQR